MNISKTTFFAAALAFGLSSAGAMAADPAEGVKRVGEGTVDAVTSPGKIAEGISEHAEKHGPVAGTVTGTATGSVQAAGQAVKGGAKIGVGAVETGAGVVQKVLEPVTGGD